MAEVRHEERMIRMDQHDVDSQRRILTGSRWHLSDPFYDFLQSLSFADDGHGEMIHGYAQAIRILVKFKYELLGHGQLRFEYLDTSDDTGHRTFAPSEDNRLRQVGFEIVEGRHERAIETLDGRGILLCRYSLRFDRDPFPERFQPEERELTYYGWPLGSPRF
jgi:hypothetical protein